MSAAKNKAKAARERISNKERGLFRALLALGSLEECERFMIDLCTPAEIAALADRWWVAQLVDRKVPYREIQARTGVSTATVTRVARALVHGENGYRAVLDKTKNGAP
jgi:TrpR-related protein YerC/YecD